MKDKTDKSSRSLVHEHAPSETIIVSGSGIRRRSKSILPVEPEMHRARFSPTSASVHPRAHAEVSVLEAQGPKFEREDSLPCNKVNGLLKRNCLFWRHRAQVPMPKNEGAAAASRVLSALYSFLLADGHVPPLAGIAPARLRALPAR